MAIHEHEVKEWRARPLATVGDGADSKIAPNPVAYVENRKLAVELAIPGALTGTIDVKMLEDGVYLTAPAREIEYAAALALGCP